MKKLVLIISIIFSLNSVVMAQSFDELKEELSKQPTSACLGYLTKAMDIQFIAFQSFLDDTFRTKSSNSSLTNIAIARFTEYRMALEELYAQIDLAVDYNSKSNEGAESSSIDEDVSFGFTVKYDTSVDNKAYSECYKAMQEKIEEGRNIMVQHIKNSTAQKKTMMILEKYESINSKMRDLNFEIAQMYGYFLTFKDKLHWINGKCVQ